MLMNEAIETYFRLRKARLGKTTASQYLNELRQVALYFRNADVETISLTDIADLMNYMLEVGYDCQSVCRKITALRTFLRSLRAQNYRVPDPMFIEQPRIEFDPANMPRVANDEDFQKLLAAIPETNLMKATRDRAIFHLLYDTGARNGEICSLNVSSIDRKKMEALIHTEKARRTRPYRRIFWSRETHAHLLRWMDVRMKLLKKRRSREPDALFVSIKRRIVQRINVAIVAASLREYSAMADIEYLNAHSFRHRKAHEILRKGGSLADVMNILGHASLESSIQYTVMVDEELSTRAMAFLAKDGETKVINNTPLVENYRKCYGFQ